jgi:mannosyltransferase OCH1-like enzyme
MNKVHNNIFDSQNHIKILQPNIASNINYKDDVFIYHFMAYSNSKRINCMKPIYYRYNYPDSYNEKNLYKLLNNHDNNFNNKLIPNILFQTYYDKSKIPQYIFDNIKKYANNYEYILYDDNEAIEFLEKYYSKIVVNTFKKLKLGAHKADLLRYCYLYINGGIYLDIKTILVKQLDEIFIDKTYFYSCISFVKGIYQGVIASPPRNILFLALINKIVNTWEILIKFNYLIFCEDMFKKIKNDTLNNKLTNGLNKGRLYNYYLFEEKCTSSISDICPKLDRYKRCCSIYDNNNLLFIGRDPNFPW